MRPESSLRPPWVRSTEDERRWLLSIRTILAAFAYDRFSVLDGLDRTLVLSGAASMYHSEYPTGDDQATDEEIAWMREQGLL